MGNQEAESGDNTKDAEPKGATSLKNNSNAQAERPIGASAARISGPQEGEPKGANTPETKELEQPKGDPNQEIKSNAQAERPIGASAARILGPQEGEPKGANKSEAKELEQSKIPENRSPQWWRRRPSKWEKPGGMLLPGKVHWGL